MAGTLERNITVAAIELTKLNESVLGNNIFSSGLILCLASSIECRVGKIGTESSLNTCCRFLCTFIPHVGVLNNGQSR